jgi:hypothetical protein
MNWLQISLVGFVFLGSFIFVVHYGLFTRWNASAEGKNLFWFSAVVTLALGISLVSIVWRDFPARTTMRVVLYIGISVVVWWRTILYFRTRRKARRTK